ncbi:beta-N-acetylhexosaminidase [Luteibacter sp. UNCMF331Sha3.1]|uniref:beta-N-acetylhexosaminidase n=1 Tax=Luteibacter sp. UNCMF331Sha3.1 TaxID=1502760 RepID=UPI0008D06941|nr:beta-N-acetylhexosaminidase [Luteibacter sp. UNCMF331Sha3.1]SEN34640.1 beta-N-acetylhexosaminidase [Luteibacter sp. UNCMF331Sha3.1]
MLIIGLAGTELAPHEHGQLLAPGVVGAILFARNFASREQVTALIASIRDVAGDDFLVCVDQEGGRVQRFRDGFTALPPLAAIGAYYDRDPVEAVNRAEEHAWIMASEMRAIGVDFSFAPVADVGHGNRAIGNRAFHADPEIAAELVQAYVRGMHLGGMAAVLKHFPGHGFVREDTHEAAAVDSRSKAEIFDGDLKPFIAGIEAHAEAVMAAHVTYTAIDDQPAGYSHVWIEEILRGELGFRGCVFGDDISMAAAGSAGGIAARAAANLDAGCDLVLACFPDVVPEAIAAVKGRRPSPVERIAPLRGAIGSTWEGLVDNPQRERFIARVTALES